MLVADQQSFGKCNLVCLVFYFRIIPEQLPPLSLQIPGLIKSSGRGTIKEPVALTGANRNAVKKHVEALVNAQRLQQNGTGKRTRHTFKR